jgi:hypothetical protein
VWGVHARSRVGEGVFEEVRVELTLMSD